MNINERNGYLWLNHFKTMRECDRQKLINHYGGVKTLAECLSSASGERAKDIEELLERKLIKHETAEEIREDDADRWYETLQERMDRSGVRVVTPADEAYPDRLRYLADNPVALYYRGDIQFADQEHSIGIIGSRRPTHYGMNVADEYAGELSRKGFVIVSGMAMGIDSRAHIGARREGGKTIAVLGGGVDICYPRTNFEIYQYMCENALVLSEYEPGEAHLPLHFPLRNRLISGLSDGILVVEAALRSGTLITTDYALEQGKDIYAIPGRVGDMMSKGANNLIKNGAMLVDSPADIIMYVLEADYLMKKGNVNVSGTGAADEKNAHDYANGDGQVVYDTTDKSSKSRRNKSAGLKDSKKEKKDSLTETQKKILGMLGYEPVYIDDLIRANDMDISGTLREIRSLEEMGKIRSIEQSYYLLV